MAITRIKTDNISNQAVTTDKIADEAITGGKLANNLTYGSDLIVSGNLTVMGSTATVESTTVTVADPLLVLASGQSGAAAVDAGLVIERGTDTNVALIWDESADRFVAVSTTEDGTTSGNVTIGSYADFEAAALYATSVDAGNISISGNTISSTDGNGNITLAPDGIGAVIIAAGNELQVSDLTAGSVLIAGANGALVDSADLTFDSATGTLSATQADLGDLAFSGDTISSTGDIVLDANGGLGVIDAGGAVLTNLGSPVGNSDVATKAYVDAAVSTGGATISQDDTSVTVVDDGTNPGQVQFVVDNTTVLTVDANGATFAGATSVDNLTLSGNTISSTDLNGNITLDPNGTGVVDVQGTLTVSGLTAGQVVYAGADGALVSEAGFEYDSTTDTLTAGTITASTGLSVTSLVSGKVVVTGASGALAVDTDLEYDTATDTFTAPNIVASSSLEIGSLTSGRVLLAGADGVVTDDAGLTYSSGAVTAGDLTLSTLHGTGALTAVSGTFSGLTATRIPFVGVGGLLTDDADFTYTTASDTLTVSNITSTGTAALGVIKSSNLTAGRVVYATTNGELTDEAGFEYDATTDTLTVANLSVTGLTLDTLDVNVSATIANLTVEDLTSGRVVLAGTGGELVDSADLLFNTGTSTFSAPNINGTTAITTPSMTVSGLTSGRVLLAGAGGLLSDDAGMTYNTVTGALTVGSVIGDVTGQVSDISNHDTDDLAEGSLNLYYTDARARGAISASGDLSYDSANGVISYTTPTTDGITEGTTNLYFTQARARSSLSAGTGVSYDSATGAISIGQSVGTTDSVTFNTVTADLSGNVLGNVTGNVTGDLTGDVNATDVDTVNLSVTGSADFGSVKLTNVADPTAAQDAATKNYVDSQIGAVNTLTISDGTSSDAVTVGTDTFTIAGTANEIETAVTDNTVTIGLPSDVTIGNDLTVTGDLSAATADIAGAADVGGNFSVATTQFTVDALTGNTVVAGTLDVTGNVTLSGNLTVNGTTTTVNTTDLNVTDKNITIADGSADAAAANGAGITVAGANATITYSNADDRWNLNKDLNVSMLYGDVTGDVTGTVSDISNHDTDDLSEGTTNLYFTQSRARNSLSAGTGVTYDSATGAISIGQAVGTTDNVTFNQVTADVIGTVSSLSNHDTDDLVEGVSNLYYTDTRSRAALSGGTGVTYSSVNGTISIGQAVGTTDNVTFASVTADLTGNVTGTVSDISNHDTDDLAEGLANLYYTDGRARAALSVTDAGGDGSLSYNSTTGVLTYTGPSAAEVRAHFSAGTGVTITNGLIEIGQAVGTGDSVTFNSVTAGSLTSTGSTAGQVFYAGTGGLLKSESVFTYDESTDTLNVSNIEVSNITAFGITNTYLVYSDSGVLSGTSDFTIDSGTATLSATNLSTSGTATIGTVDATTVKVSGLTAGRIVFTTTDGELEDDLTLTFDSTTDTVTASNVDVTGVLTGGTIKANGLSSGRVIFATTDGELSDDSTFLFDNATDTLTVTNVSVGTQATLASAAVSDLTAGRVVLAGVSGELQDSAGLLFDAGSGALTVTGSVSVDNISINGNTISSADSNGDIVLNPDGTGRVDVSSAYIINVADPVNAQDAATKAYVDAALSSNVTTIAQNNTSVEVIDNNIAAGVVDVTIDGILTAKFTDTALEISNSLEVDNITLDSNTISTTDLNGDLILAPNGSGSVVVDSGKNFKISDLASGQIVYTGANGLLKAEAGFEYNESSDTLTVQNVTVDSALTLSTFSQNNILFVGAGGVVSEDADLTWDGTDFTVNGGLVVIGDADIDNINIDGNTISSTDSNGNLVLQPNGTGSVVINDAGNSSDLQIKSVNQTHMLFVDASADVIGIKTNTPNAEAALHIASTDSIIVPVGTQAQRPATAATGMFRFNTTAEKLEVFDGTEWVAIGANNTTTVTSETFAGDGTTVNFTLAQNSTTASVVVSINGVVQIPGTAYSVSGSTLTFTEAPESGDTIEVRTLVTAETVQTVIGSDDGTSILAYDAAGDQFVFTVGSSTMVIVDDQGIDLRSGAAIICGDASTAVGTTATTVDSFAAADYRVAKYVAQISNVGLGEYQAVEVLVVHNGTTATVTEYAEVYTGSASLGSFSAAISAGNVELKFTGANAGNTVKVMPTFIKA